MDSSAQQHTGHTMRRRSFVLRAVSAVAAGLSGGHLLRHFARGASRPEDAGKKIAIRPHPDAVSRTSPRPPSHD